MLAEKSGKDPLPIGISMAWLAEKRMAHKDNSFDKACNNLLAITLENWGLPSGIQ